MSQENNHTSLFASLIYSVPQGSVLRPTLFLMHMFPLGHIIQRHGVPVQPLTRELSALHDRIADVKNWVFFFQLNSTKTEVCVIGSQQMVKQCLPSAGSLVHCIKPTALNLSIWFDVNLDFKPSRHKTCTVMSLPTSTFFF